MQRHLDETVTYAIQQLTKGYSHQLKRLIKIQKALCGRLVIRTKKFIEGSGQ